MANEIRLVVDSVRGTIANFEQRRGEFESTFNALKAIVFDLAGTWIGEAESAYENQFRQLITNLATINQGVDGAIERMNLAINTYEALEAENKTIIEIVDPGAANYGVQ